MEKKPMEIIKVPVSKIQEYEGNPRRINDHAVEVLAKSIREFGFKVPVVLDKERVIVTGHTRLLAAKRLGLEEVPCIVADDLSPEQIKAFRLVDNKTAELTGWDFEKLELELEDLDFDVSEFDFEIPEEVNVDDLFETREVKPKDKSSHVINCPECGAEIEVKK